MIRILSPLLILLFLNIPQVGNGQTVILDNTTSNIANLIAFKSGSCPVDQTMIFEIDLTASSSCYQILDEDWGSQFAAVWNRSTIESQGGQIISEFNDEGEAYIVVRWNSPGRKNISANVWFRYSCSGSSNFSENFNGSIDVSGNEPSISINRSNVRDICAGATIPYSISSSSNMGSSPTYNWYVDNQLVQSGSSRNFNLNTNSEPARVYCEVTVGTDVCALNRTARSGTSRLYYLRGDDTPELTISGSSGSTCRGEIKTYTANFDHQTAGNNPTIRWYVNGSQQGTGIQFDYTFNQSPGTEVTVDASIQRTDKPYCTQEFYAESELDISIRTPPATSASIQQDGKQFRINESTINVGSDSSYAWYKNGSLVNSAILNSFYVDDLLQGDQIKCVVTSDVECFDNHQTHSNTITNSINYPPIEKRKIEYVTTKETTSNGSVNYYYTQSVTLKPNTTIRGSDGDFFISPYLTNEPLSMDQNFVRAEVPREEIQSERDLSLGEVQEKATTYTYVDGLGRTMQEIQLQGSPSKLDIIQPMVYDDAGRQLIEYLPYTKGASGAYRSNAVTNQTDYEQKSFYETAAKIAHDTRPFTEHTFDHSPLNRVLSSYLPGSQWKTESKNVRNVYEVNIPNEVRRWTITPGGLPSGDDYYVANQLWVEEVIGEDEQVTKEYTNGRGQLILSRVKARDTPLTWYDSYYIYDDFGNLRFVIPQD